MKNRIKVKIDVFNNFIKPLIASIVMIIAVMSFYIHVYTYTNSNTISCLFAILLGGIIYILAIVILKIFSIKEITSKINN